MKDIYMFDDVPVLKNRLNIRDSIELNIVESQFATTRLAEIDSILTCSKDNFSLDYLKKIHKYIFGDIYDWAGEIRKVNIYKAENVLNGMSVDYSDRKYIEKNFKEAMKELDNNKWKEFNTFDELVKKFSKGVANLWKVHPFREGNTRTIIKFSSHYAKAHGFPLKEELFKINAQYTRDALVLSSVRESPEPKYLEDIISESIRQGKEELNNQRMNSLYRQRKNLLDKDIDLEI